MYNICPNCLTNEWNDNENQICIHCKLDLSHIDFTLALPALWGAKIIEEKIFYCKKNTEHGYSKHVSRPVILLKYPWIICAPFRAARALGAGFICHVKHQTFWRAETAYNSGEDFCGFEHFEKFDVETLKTTIERFLKNWPAYSLKDLIK